MDRTSDPEFAGYSVYPEWTEQLGALGLHQLGLASSIHADFDPLLLEEPDRSWWVANHSNPSVIFRDEAGSCFVNLCDVFGHPAVNFRTVTIDGSVVQTRRFIAHRLAVTTELFFRETRHQQMMTAHGPARGRSIEIVTTDSADVLWRHHRAHVERLGHAIRNHDTIRDFITMDAAQIQQILAIIRGRRTVGRLLFQFYLFPVITTVTAVTIGAGVLYGLVLGATLAAIGIPVGYACALAGVWYRRRYPPLLCMRSRGRSRNSSAEAEPKPRAAPRTRPD